MSNGVRNDPVVGLTSMNGFSQYQFPFARYPAVRIVLLMSAGIVTSYYFFFDSYIWTILLGTVLFLTYWLRKISHNSLNVGLYYFMVGSYLCTLFLFGATWHSMNAKGTGSFAQSLLDTYSWEQVRFSGELNQIKQTVSGKYQLDVDIDSTTFSASLLMQEKYRLRSILDKDDSSSIEQLELGDRISFVATVYPLEEIRNPKQFDYKKFLSSQGIYHQAGIDSVISITKNQRWLSWNGQRKTIMKIIEQNFSNDTKALAKALLIGYKNELTNEDKLAFSRVGLSHIMAVSGLHVGFILAPFWFLIPYCWTYRYGRQLGLAALVLLLFYYAGLTGFSASVCRASLTGGFIMYARLFNKIRDSVNLTSVAAIIILLADPSEIFEIGFQLSFSAVYIILLIIPVISSLVPSRIRYRWYSSILMIVIVSFCVQLGLFPFLSYYFGEFSIIGPLTNAAVVPFLGLLVPYAMLLLPISAISPDTGYLLNIPNQYFLQFLDYLVAVTSSWEFSWIQTGIPGVLLFAIWPTSIFLIASRDLPNYRWKLLIVLISLLCIGEAAAIFKKMQPQKLEITFFDVGQGDAALIKSPRGRHFLIDTGRWSPSYNSGKYTILPHLKSAGIEKLDAIFLSHPHADHIGGIVEILETFPVDTVYNSGYKYDSKLYKDYLEIATKNNIPIVSLTSGMQVPIDSAMRLFVYGPESLKEGADPNEHSLILELIYGESEFLFMGDAGEEQETKLIQNYPHLLDTDLLKVGHHGSKTSSSPPFLNTSSPDISVVSLAMTNKFKHPHRQTINRLYASETMLYFTSLEGAIVFTTDGKHIRKKNWR